MYIVSVIQISNNLSSMTSECASLLLHAYRQSVQEGAHLVIASVRVTDELASGDRATPSLLRELSEYVKLGTPLLLATYSQEIREEEARELMDYRMESCLAPYLLEKNRVTLLPEAEPITLLQQRMNIIIGDTESVCEESLDLTIRFSTSPWYKGSIDAQIASRCWEARMQKSSIIYIAPLYLKEKEVYPGGSYLVDATGTVVSRMPYFADSYGLFKI